MKPNQRAALAAMTGLLMAFQLAGTLAAGAPTENEPALLAILRGNNSPAVKAEACKNLRLVGTVKAVPLLEAMLLDESVSQAARYALEGLALPEVDRVLRDALPATSGLVRQGIIDSLGVRGDPLAVPLLAPLLTRADAQTAAGAATALGRIGGTEAVSVLQLARAEAPAENRGALGDGLLRCAERLLTEGRSDEARRIYDSLLGPAEPMPVRAAAFAGLLRTDPKHRSRQILDALEGPSLEFAHVALAEAGSTDDPELRQLLMAAWPRLAPDRQIGIVYLFKASGDPATLPVVLAAAQSPDAAVRNAAWTALGELGDASTVSPLAEAAASRQGDERTAARQALVALHRGPIAAALVAQLETAPAPVQAEIARALRDRAENGATPALLALTGDERASVRQAALRTLAPLTEAYHWEPLLDVLLRLPDEESRRLARDALAALNQRAKSGPPLDPAILAQKLAAASGPLRIQLLPLCAWFSDDRLRAALRADLESADAGVRAAAANAICATEDKTLLADLVKLAGNAEDATVRTSALARAAALVVKHGASLPGSDPGTTIATLYRQTARPEDKWLILGAAARLPYRATLQLADEAMADASVRAEAEFALLQIARLLGSAEAVAVRAAMARLATEATEEKVRTEARIWRGDGAPGVRQIYNLPAGDAGTMLREVAATASLKLDYRPDDVRAVSGRTLQGDLTVTEALTRLLAGSPLEAVADPASGTITVRRRER